MPADPEPETAAPPRRGFDWRLVPAALLLAAAAVLTWSVVVRLEARRVVRTELAEISHARYGLLSADRWVKILTPILDSRIDTLDLQPAKGASLRPMVQNALYRLLDDVKEKMSAKPAPGSQPSPGAFLAQGNTMIVNMIIGALRPHVPEYTEMVLKELGRPEARTAVKNYIRSALVEGAASTFGHVDTTWRDAILREHGCADAESCKPKLASEIAAMDDAIRWRWVAVLGASAIGFILLLPGPLLTRSRVVALLAFAMLLLAGGLLTPMLEVEAKITNVRMTFLGTPISFNDQVLYFQSKSVLEVFRTLINMKRPDMWVVGVLVLMFSVVFPGLKLLASAAALWRPALLRNRIVRFFALESSKWSMADVMALAIFMAYVAFNGLIGNSLGILRQTGAELTIPTDSSKILPGYYLFIGFCLASLLLARKMGKGIAVAREEP